MGQTASNIKNFERNQRLPQLDGVRGLAIMGVLVAHYYPSSLIDLAFHWGRLGVLLFFVLSGFLITGILLRAKEQFDLHRVSPWKILARFFTRRAIRIFPAYYLALAIYAWVGYPAIHDFLLWHITYTSNFAGPFLDINFGFATHFWSLCVEEQYYLIWPLLVLFVRKSKLPIILFIIVASGLLYKFLGNGLGLTWPALTRPLFGCVESLSLGSLLAFAHFYKNEGLLRGLLITGTRLGVPALLGLQLLRIFSVDFRENIFYVVFIDTAAAFSFLLLINFAAKNKPSRMGSLLSWSPLRYLGTISYGVYIHHFLLLAWFPRILNRMGFWPLAPEEKFLLFSTTAILIASISWHLIETPINRLKQFFPYYR